MAGFLVVGVAISAKTQVILRQTNTHCSNVAEIMDGTDRQAIGYAVQFLADVLADADRPFVERKRGSVTVPLSDDGLVGVVSMVIVKCRKAPETLARDAAIDVYVNLRKLDTQMGLVK